MFYNITTTKATTKYTRSIVKMQRNRNKIKQHNAGWQSEYHIKFCLFKMYRLSFPLEALFTLPTYFFFVCVRKKEEKRHKNNEKIYSKKNGILKDTINKKISLKFLMYEFIKACWTRNLWTNSRKKLPKKYLCMRVKCAFCGKLISKWLWEKDWRLIFTLACHKFNLNTLPLPKNFMTNYQPSNITRL